MHSMVKGRGRRLGSGCSFYVVLESWNVFLWDGIAPDPKIKSILLIIIYHFLFISHIITVICNILENSIVK